MEYCYILKFKKYDLVKIGRTTNIIQRISQLRKQLGVDFELMESYLFQCKKLSNGIEQQLLFDTINDFIPKDHPYSLPKKSRMTYDEIRLQKNIPSVVELLKQKSSKLDLPIIFYEGIDISCFKSDLIPIELVPYDSPIENDLDLFIKEAKEIIAKENKPPIVVYHEIFYHGLLAKGVKFELPNRIRKKNCFYARM